MEESPEVKLPPVIKSSNRQEIQERVDEKLTQMEEENPSTDFEKTNLEFISANKSARDMVASELKLERSTERADFDKLTGIYNRRGFENAFRKKLKTVDRTDGKLFGVFIDANGLKKINDEKGHEAGDAYLKEIAGALKESSRETDIVARLGGDEYLAVLDSNDIDGLFAWWDRFNNGSVNVSAGAVEINPENHSNWMTNSDEAMYAAKLLKKDGKSHLMVVGKDGNFEEYIPGLEKAS